MSKFLAGIAALTLAGAAMMPIQASAAEAKTGIATKSGVTTSNATEATEFSARRRHWRHRHHYGHRHWGPRRYYGYRYYRPYPYYGYGYPYRYYRPGPAISFGFGPFGFGVF